MTATIPYGLREVKITPYTGVGEALAASSIKLPASRSFSFTEAEDFEELRGDDGVITVRGKGAGVEWELEGGGIDLSVAVAMYGGTMTASGTGATLVETMRKLGTDQRPFFKIDGRSISDSGGDFVGTVYKCRATDNLELTQEDGSFLLYGASGSGIPRQTAITGTPAIPAQVLYDLVSRAQAAALP